MTRTMASRKLAAAERDTRRDSLLVLLSRLDRGVLAPTERALLRAHVDVEVSESNHLRSTIQGQQRALAAAEARTRAAEAAIVEAERDRDRAVEELAAAKEWARTATAAALRLRAQTATAAHATLGRIRAARTWADVWSQLGMFYGLTPEQAGAEARARRTAAERAAEQRRRTSLANIELHTLRAGLRANGADPTQIQNLWAQIRLRNRQWRAEKQRAERAEAAVERVRALATNMRDWDGDSPAIARWATDILAALDEHQEQPGPATHTGGNAEDCPACSGAALPYPFICPGPAKES